MKILLINLDFDCAGVSWTLRNQLQAMGHTVIHTMYRKTHVAEKTDFLFQNVGQVAEIAADFDVLHFNEWLWLTKPENAMNYFPGKESSAFDKVLSGKKVFFHFHGGRHQLVPKFWLDECDRIGATVFQCDPLSGLGKWMPNILDWENIPAPVEGGVYQVVNIAVMGSWGDIRRNNAHIDDVLKYVARYYPIRHQMFGEIARHQALQLRTAYDISIDNLTQGFIGMWGWESMAMGQVLFARIDQASKLLYESTLGAVPIADVANTTQLGQAIGKLCDDRTGLKSMGAHAHAWMLERYTKEKIADLYVREYENAQVS